MTLDEIDPGSMCIVLEAGGWSWVVVGGHLGLRHGKKRARDAWSTLVHDIDPETMLPPPGVRDVRMVSPRLDVIAVIASGEFLRAMRSRWYHLGVSSNERDAVDPMTRVDPAAQAAADEELAF